MQRNLKLKVDIKEYHLFSLILSCALICFSMFFNGVLVYISFAIQIYRLIRYSEKVFLTDLICLLSFSNIYRLNGGLSLYYILMLIGVIWLSLKNIIFKQIKINIYFIVVFALLGYLLIRCNISINDFLMYFSGFMIIVLLSPTISFESSIFMSKMMCVSLIISSILGWVLRDTPELLNFTQDKILMNGGEDFFRFKGLFSDPNYFSVCLILAICIICILYITKKISFPLFLLQLVFVLLFGFLTYSKTFVLVSFLLFLMFFIPSALENKRYFSLIVMCIVFSVFIYMFIYSNINVFVIIRNRFMSDSNSLNDFTTGRSGLWIQYLEKIFKSSNSILFGYGSSAELLELGTHSLYIESLYYFGLIGFVLMVYLFAYNFFNLKKKFKNKKNIIQYIVLFAFLISYFSLQGLASPFMYIHYLIVLIGTSSSYERQDWKVN